MPLITKSIFPRHIGSVRPPLSRREDISGCHASRQLTATPYEFCLLKFGLAPLVLISFIATYQLALGFFC